MKAWEILGYTADADVYCSSCARKKYGTSKDRVDSEGNEVHPIFASDEADPAGEYCGECGCEVVEPAESEEA